MAVNDSGKKTVLNGISSANSEANLSINNKRRSARVVIDIPVTVFGQDSDGKIFGEITKTLTVSAHGCLVRVNTVIDPQKPALLVNTKTGAEIQCRIAYRKEIEPGLHEIGLDFEQPVPRFWGVNFPPEDWNPADRKKATRPQTLTSNSIKATK
jgi:hypothetical protein